MLLSLNTYNFQGGAWYSNKLCSSSVAAVKNGDCLKFTWTIDQEFIILVEKLIMNSYLDKC